MATPKKTAAAPYLSPAAMDLGMGDELKQQMAQAEEERKRKLMQQQMGMSGMRPGTLALFGVGG